MKNIKKSLISKLIKFRKQGLEINDINPISALADIICEELYSGKLKKSEIEYTLKDINTNSWKEQVSRLQQNVGFSEKKINFNLKNIDITQPIYTAVFTAHPVFRLNNKLSSELSRNADHSISTLPERNISIRESISLNDEHNEAINAMFNARNAINEINYTIITNNKKNKNEWKTELPLLIGVSTWVGYDLDGRSDINWKTSLILRLKEKKYALEYYIKKLYLTKIIEIKHIIEQLKVELTATKLDIKKFESIEIKKQNFSNTINKFTNRKNKLTSSYKVSKEIHKIANNLSNTNNTIRLMVIAADIKKHGFGVGEIHFRVNATHIRNAMRPVDGKGISASKGQASTRVLMERLSNLILKEKTWKINFKNIVNESATARRQLMLAKQFLKHIDSDQPIRFLIAECEKPITILSALYLVKKIGLQEKVDISPLFETTKALEHGHQIIEQLISYKAFIDYVKNRGKLCIQTGFSDAGRFIGQIAANLAIERLQIKVAEIIKKKLANDITLLIFNTHGESLGRGGGKLGIKNRQDFILTPYVRHKLNKLKLSFHHQSSFQGGDGYLMFGTKKLAKSTIQNILKTELTCATKPWVEDMFYKKSDFALDLFLSLKDFQEKIFNDSSYYNLLTVFSTNLLPKAGSRPSTRAIQANFERQDLSKIRAIPHNATLQQLGFLVNVISGFGKSAFLDIDQFLEIYKKSPRLKQCMEHVLNAKYLGSLNTTLAYSKIVDGGFWVNKSYHGKQHQNLRAFRKLSSYLLKNKQSDQIKKIVWKLRDDLLDLYSLAKLTNKKNIRVGKEERLVLDILHSIRIALITDSLILLSQVPNISESNDYNHDDILALGLKLDFTSACEIIKKAFSASSSLTKKILLLEKESYSKNNIGTYKTIDRDIIKPIEYNQKLIYLITNLVSSKYGAHG